MQLNKIEQRLQRLETENRIMKKCGLLFALVMGATLLLGQAAPPRTVEAQEFVVKDARGRKRIVMNIGDDGDPHLMMYGQSRPIVSISGSERGGFLSLTNRSGTRAISMAVFDGGVMLVARDEPRSAFIELSTIAGAHLEVKDLKDEPLSMLSTSAPQVRIDATSVLVQDKEGFSAVLGKVSLVAKRTGETREPSAASLAMFDKDGKVIWKAP